MATETMSGVGGSFTATYHDTPDRRLARANISLRRRMENGVGLWEAEIAGRVVSAPGGPADLPDEVAQALVAPLRGGHVIEIARMRTADDVALLEGQHVLRTYEDEHDALHDTLGEPGKQPRRDAPALEHVRSYLAAQVAEIERTDPVLRLAPDIEALHDLRVAIRRSRALLRSAAKLFEPDWVDSLRSELKWLGRELGPGRDLDVLIAHLKVERESIGVDADPVIGRLEREHRAARKRVTSALQSARYLVLLDALAAAVDHPPVREAERRLDKVARRAFAKLRKEVDGLGAKPSDEALHRVRIRGKRARYAAELAEPIVGSPARKFVKSAKRFQDVVGEHQDAVVAERRIRAFAETADAAFGAGRLVERERRRRLQARAELPRAWKRLERRGRKAWT